MRACVVCTSIVALGVCVCVSIRTFACHPHRMTLAHDSLPCAVAAASLSLMMMRSCALFSFSCVPTHTLTHSGIVCEFLVHDSLSVCACVRRMSAATAFANKSGSNMHMRVCVVHDVVAAVPPPTYTHAWMAHTREYPAATDSVLSICAHGLHYV